MSPFKKSHQKLAQSLNLTPGASVKTPRNAFDMSYHNVFNSPAGMLLPNYVQEVQPDDYLTLDVSHFSRTMPVNTAAFSRFRECCDFYFVPNRLLWQWFDGLITGVNDVHTSLYPTNTVESQNLPSSLPSISATEIWNILSNNAEVDIYGFKINIWAERMLDLLGYSVSNDSAIPTLDMYAKYKALTPQPTFNPLRLLAFQRIYNDFYRNSDYEVPVPNSFNIDKLSSGQAFDATFTKPLFTPRYVQWKKDRYTSIKPNPLLSPVQSANLIPNIGEGLDANSSGASSIITSSSETSLQMRDVNSAFSASKLRAMLAVDKVNRLSMLTPKLYDKQLKTHFGVEPDHCDYCSVKYLGSYDSMLNIGEVTATATGMDGTDPDSSRNVLGQISGKGICRGGQNNVIKAHFTEHGIVMGIHYFLPFSEYDSNYIHDFNTKFTRHDYYIPEYDNLGLQGLKNGQIGIDPSIPASASLNYIVGYQARYLEYKTRVDEVHGLFQSKKQLSPWCSPRTVVRNSTSVGVSDLHVNPKITDTLFALKYDGSQLADPFICHWRYDATLVRNMSVLGIPSM